MVAANDEASDFDPEAVRAKYEAERDKRMVTARAAIRDLAHDEAVAKYRADPFTPMTDRDPVTEDVEVAIIGAGIAGIVAGAQLRKHGIDAIRLIDQAGGVGGTWYWNRYPGVMCDVESYCYMPMLEEMEYIPTKRYAQGEEIREHVEAIARAIRSRRRRAVPHRRADAPSGTKPARAGCSTPIAATRSTPGTWSWPSGSSTS